MTWIKACSASDIEDDCGYKLETNPPIAVFMVDGELRAIDDTCSHAESSLSEGYVEDGVVECAWHMARFDLKTGAALCLPATRGLQTYSVRTDKEDVYVDVPAHMLEGAPVA